MTNEQPARRYLWTDAFAVMASLELLRQRKDESWAQLATLLVDRVHHTLGRHRADAVQQGWLSGLSERQGERHPTRGGLRIGKPLPNRHPALVWKMSIDLSGPLVAARGQHDPVDGFITCAQLRATALLQSTRPGEPLLDYELTSFAAMLPAGGWSTLREHARFFAHDSDLRSLLAGLAPYVELREHLEAFWLDEQNRAAPAWQEHRDINDVMLASSLLPDGSLLLHEPR